MCNNWQVPCFIIHYSLCNRTYPYPRLNCTFLLERNSNKSLPMAGGRVNVQEQHKQTIGRKKSGQLIPQLTACDSDGNAIASDREIGEVPDQRK